MRRLQDLLHGDLPLNRNKTDVVHTCSGKEAILKQDVPESLEKKMGGTEK